ncbi:MAG: N-acetylglucosamine-6-phosphate deacetylase [Chitinophagaceae bacterium]|nr:MAG: N-acetylglucosamine-6-phosphate deacetylase [Chitinophagaceae bacterium]
MIYSADAIFDGQQWRTEAIGTQDGLCTGWVPAGRADRHFAGCRIVPAFVDIQVYGAGGRLFSAYPDSASLRVLAEENLAGGTALCQPTVATNSPGVMRACIDAVRQYWEEGGEGIAGLHLEGPWINPEKRGAHLVEYIHQPTLEEVEELLAYGKDVIRTITLAPECCPGPVLQMLKASGIVLSAGHSAIGFNAAMDAFTNNGITTITHLYNAMSALHHREPGLVGAAFLHPEVYASIIPDDIHVDLNAVRIAYRQMKGRLFAITDAVTETAIGPYPHTLTENSHYTSKGTLSGSALSMYQAFSFLRTNVTGEPEEALRMCGTYPARVIGLDHYGKLGPGAAASFLVFDEAWSLVEVISEPGSRSPSLCGVHTAGTTRW